MQLKLFGFRDAHTHFGTPRARQFESGELLRAMKFEKAVPHHSPRQKFLQPVCASHEYGWEQSAEAAYPSGSQTSRHPRLNSHITLHAEMLALHDSRR